MTSMLTRTLLLLSGALLLLPSVSSAQIESRPVPGAPDVAFTGTPVPLLSLQSLQFLHGTWSATSRDGRTSLGTYSFVPELNSHVLARESVVDPACDATKHAACGRRDRFYIYQESAGAPLQAISFDSEGHVIRYFVSLSSQASTSTLGRRDFVVFDSDPTQLGPRVRLRYEHNIDTQTGKDVLNGAFEVLQPDGRFLDVQQWYGTRQ
jgi:hypothetical protein